jgi:CPA2 family monovalent cation:H+ antiporter-2
MRLLRDLGVRGVVQPEFEAGLEITRQALLEMNVADSDVRHFTDLVREKLYAPFLAEEEKSA